MSSQDSTSDPKLHRLLQRQLKRLGLVYNSQPEHWRQLAEMVSAAYQAFDEDRGMLERSLELSSQELLQANSEMRAVFLAFPDLFLWLDEGGTILNVQSGDDSDLYLEAEPLLGKRIQEIPEPEARQKFDLALNQVQVHGKLVCIDYPLRVSGQLHYFEARLLPLVMGRVLAIIRNITERKQGEQALQEEKRRLSVTLQSIGEGVIACDAGGKVTLFNEVAELLTGWQRGQAIGRSVTEVLRIVTEEGSRPITDLIGFARLEPKPASPVLMSRDGRGQLIDLSGAALAEQGGEPGGQVFTFRDVTLRRKAEAERVRASKLDSVGLLAGGIAHDFNNILSAVLTNLSVASLEAPEGTELAEVLADTEVAVRRAGGLTQQLLTFSKGGSPIKSTASVSQLLRESAEFALRGSNVRCDFEFDGELWPVEIDQGQINQVINNLVINADHAMPSGGKICIRAENVTAAGNDRAQLPADRCVRITIEDRGVGIPSECLDRIFDPYFTTKQRGSGLGLATSYAIVRNHSGTLTVESVVGEGTVFHLILPASKPVLVSEDAAADQLHRGSGRILVMDDERPLRRAATRILKRLGYQVAAVEDGSEALELYQRAARDGEPFAAVLMDLTIPGGMGGAETIAALRAIDPDVCAIASSGYSNDPVMAHYADHGFSGILAKPYDMRQLSRALHDVLSSRASSDTQSVVSG